MGGRKEEGGGRARRNWLIDEGGGKRKKWTIQREMCSGLTYFCLLAICALTWASTLVGSCTASVPSTLIRLEMRTETGKRGIQASNRTTTQ